MIILRLVKVYGVSGIIETIRLVKMGGEGGRGKIWVKLSRWVDNGRG